MTLQKPNSVFESGQCWTSEGEPELGIGFVRALDEMSVALEFPSSTQGRMYRKRTAPLRRLEFRSGEKILSNTGVSLLIDHIETRENRFWYIASDGRELCESDLSPSLTLQRPVERFLAGHWDPDSAFKLRREALSRWNRHLHSPARGMIGPKAQLLPHQLYVAAEICRRGRPRALLADEVGLGKTIEAAWIMHRLLMTGRIRRVLILAPEALVNQWFVELFKRFNLSFWVPGSQSEADLEAEDLESEERVILSHESLAKLREDGVLKDQSWDLVIVDEAHRIGWTEEATTPEYEILSDLAKRSPGLLLLTATPEQLGLAGHFSRLHLIDPLRFPSLKAFEREHSSYLKVVQLAERLLSDRALTQSEWKALHDKLDGKVAPELLTAENYGERKRELALALVDFYGTGRVYFRNSRSIVQIEDCFFPKRSLERHLLATGEAESGAKALTLWLADFAQTHRGEKTLLICDSARKVVEWEKRLRDDFALKAVAFHEDLSLIARDRNAAYFEDPQGASILLCSEIGGEGRNFQNASHLILADLPDDPDVLEQRIGRLDRIGQRSDIRIHVPYFKGSREERLLRWHEDVFDGFTSPPKGAAAIYQKYREELSQDKKKGFLDFVKQARAEYVTQLEKIESGRDRLIELNSFDPEEAKKLVQTLKEAEQIPDLQNFLDELLSAFKMDGEALDADTIFITPGHSQYAAYFTGIQEDGQSFTFSRTKALARNDLGLMTWDHPALQSALESVVRQEFGNVAVASWSHPILAVECSFVLEPTATDPKWYADEFFPATPVRLVFEATGKDLTSEWSWEKLSADLSPLPPAMAAMIRKIPGEKIRSLLGRANGQAQTACAKLKSESQNKMRQTIQAEINRLRALNAKIESQDESVTTSGSASEQLWWEERMKHLESAFAGAQTRLDSFLLIVPTQT